MVHGLYGTLMKYSKEHLYNAYLKSEEYNFLSDIDHVINNEDNFDYSLYDMPKNTIIKKIRKAYDKYMTKLVHVYQLVYKSKQYSAI